jgi:hypothetical protein
MMAAIVVPAGSRSIAMTCAFLVPVRILSSADGAARAEFGRFDDLDLVAFTWRERGAVLRLDFDVVMGSSEVLYDVLRRTTSAPPKANHPAGLDPKAAAAAPISHIHAPFARECQSILSNMIALLQTRDRG